MPGNVAATRADYCLSAVACSRTLRINRCLSRSLSANRVSARRSAASAMSRHASADSPSPISADISALSRSRSMAVGPYWCRHSAKPERSRMALRRLSARSSGPGFVWTNTIASRCAAPPYSRARASEVEHQGDSAMEHQLATLLFYYRSITPRSTTEAVYRRSYQGEAKDGRCEGECVLWAGDRLRAPIRRARLLASRSPDEIGCAAHRARADDDRAWSARPIEE
jgi:hypothetical protein